MTRSQGSYRSFTRFGWMLTIAIRTRPPGIGLTLWSPKEQKLARLTAGQTARKEAA